MDGEGAGVDSQIAGRGKLCFDAIDGFGGREVEGRGGVVERMQLGNCGSECEGEDCKEGKYSCPNDMEIHHNAESHSLDFKGAQKVSRFVVPAGS